MTKKEKVLKIREAFDKVYPEAVCSLNYTKPHELLIATILAAQCTDARVNIITKELYKKYKTVESFANADFDELCKDIKSCGFFNNKAKNIIGCCKKIMSDFNGEVPRTLDELLTLDGVGRKTAGVILGDLFDTPSLVIDTHAKRVSKRLGLTKNTDPYKVELDLAKIVTYDYRSIFCHQMVYHGRAICDARKPKCSECPVENLCMKNI